MPISIRRSLGLEKGTFMFVEQEDDRIILRKAIDVFDELHEVFARAAMDKGITKEDVLRISKEVRREVYQEMYGEKT